MANICINRFYCSTDNEANYEKILYGLGDRFDLYDLDGRDNWMRGSSTRNGATPRRRSQR